MSVFHRFGAGAAVAASVVVVPVAGAAPACPVPATAALTSVAVPAPARPVLRLPASRPRCGDLVRLPASGVRITAGPGGRIVVRTAGRLVRLRPGGRRVVLNADAARDRLVVAWGRRRVVVRLGLRPERTVMVRSAAVRVTAPAVPARGVPEGGGGSASPVGGGSGTGSGSGSGVSPAPAPRPVPAPRPDAMFAADSIWNRRVEGAALAPDSDAVSADLRRQALETGTWMNTDRWSVPVYVVGAGQPRVTVTDADDGEMNLPGAWRWGTVPLPPGAVASAPHPDGDNHLVVWQPSTDTMWEFWRFSRSAAGPRALHGARIDGVSGSGGSIPSPYGASASGIALAAGMVTARDLAAGSIDHALVIGIPETRAGAFVAPATRTDGYVTRPSAPVMGSRFRLDPAVDVEALGLPPLARMVALAAQRHGIIVRDRSGAVSFYGEDPVVSGTDPFTPVLAGGEMGEVMRTFPWHHIQLVAPAG